MSKIFKLESFLYLRGLLVIVLIDSLIIDDEPLWEPIEWSLVQTWILFIFVFTWAAEVIFFLPLWFLLPTGIKLFESVYIKFIDCYNDDFF